jgi:ATP synthase protein I
MKQKFPDQVGSKEQRKIRARQKRNHGIWFGLGMFGVVGWAIEVPVVVGTFIGIWIDLHWPSAYSWTLMLLVIGLFIGCMNAWFWIQKQRRAISEELENNASE